MNLVERLKPLKYVFASRPYKLEKPIVLQFPVIDICNSQCQMCHIWKNKKSDDLSPEQLRRGLRNPLFSEVRSVGINGGEPTLRKDLGKLTEVLFEELPKLRSLSLITNAYKYKEVISRINDVATVVNKYRGHLDVMVSLDGYGDVHDRVRGKPGNFKRAEKVLDFVQSSDLIGSVRIGCTIIKANVYGLADLFEFCQSRGLYIKYRLGIPHQRLYTQDLEEPYALDNAEKYHVAEFLEGLIQHYENSEDQKYSYRSLIDQIVYNAPRKAGCDWKHRGATITSKGELLYCAVQSDVLGNIQSDDSFNAYFGNADHLSDIIRNKCANCHHDYVGIPSKQRYIGQLALQYTKRFGVYDYLREIARIKPVRDLRERIRYRKHHARIFAHTRIVASPPVIKEVTRLKVLICGWYGTETLGDKAILGGIIRALHHAFGDVDLTLMSLFPYVSKMTQREMSDLGNCLIVDPIEAAKLVRGMDLIVCGGGPLMAIDELAEIDAMFTAAQQHDIATVVAGCGIGPLGAKWHNSSIRRILSLARFRIYRDAKSARLAKALGIDTSGDAVAEDPAFTWLQAQRKTLAGYQPAPGKKVLLLGLRDFPFVSYARDLSSEDCISAKARFETSVLQALEQLAMQHSELIIQPLPMCTNHFGGDDRWFYRRLFRGHHLLERMDLTLLERELSPLEYCRVFRQANVALAMRFHSLVFALGLDVPTVSIDYTLGQGKVHSLAERFSVPHVSLLDLSPSFIVEHVNKLLQNPQTQAKDFEPEFVHIFKKLVPYPKTPSTT